MLAATLRSATAAVMLACAIAPMVRGQGKPDTSRVIRAIRIETREIFDSAEATSAVYRVMNDLHITTKPYVIQQQLTFRVGQPWDSAAVDETERNLRSLNLFRLVMIDSVRTDSGLVAEVITQDAWTLGIVFSIQSSGSQINYAVGFNSRNVLGTGTQFQMQYGKNANYDSLLFGLTRKFLLRTPYDFQVVYNSLHYGSTSGSSGWFTYGLPFRTLESTHGYMLEGNLNDARTLLFYGGDTTASDTLRRTYGTLSLNPAIALVHTPYTYARLGLFMQIQRSAFQPWSAPPTELDDSISGAFGPYLAFGHPEFIHVRYFQAGGRNEDVQLGVTGQVAAYIAPSRWGYVSTGVGPAFQLSAGQQLGGVVVQESLTVTSLYTHGGLDSGTVFAGVTAWWQPEPTKLLIGYVGGGAQKNGFPGENWDLGLNYGLRAFPQHSFTGNRAFIVAGEYRYFFAPTVYKLFAVGVAAFFDYAGAWYGGSPMRTGADYGAGLRFSSITGNPGYVMRADAAYRQPTSAVPGGWVFTFGKGFVWQVF